MKHALARRLRFLADRIDPHGAPRYTGMSFTIETGRGFVVHEDMRGCPIVYLGSRDYERAFQTEPPTRAPAH